MKPAKTKRYIDIDKKLYCQIVKKATEEKRTIIGQINFILESFFANEKPIVPKKKKLKDENLENIVPDGVTGKTWQAFIEHRKARKAPISSVVTEFIEREAKKAGISYNSALEYLLLHNWQTFKADWYKRKEGIQDSVAGGISHVTEVQYNEALELWNEQGNPQKGRYYDMVMDYRKDKKL